METGVRETRGGVLRKEKRGVGKVGNTEKRAPSLDYRSLSLHHLPGCAHIFLVFGIDSVQSTGHDESAYLVELAIKLTIGRKERVVNFLPSSFIPPPSLRYDDFDLVANLSPCCESSRDFDKKRRGGGGEERKEEEKRKEERYRGILKVSMLRDSAASDDEGNDVRYLFRLLDED